MEDSPKDVIELKDVLAVAPIRNVPGVAKKSDENAFFEVRLRCRISFLQMNCVVRWSPYMEINCVVGKINSMGAEGSANNSSLNSEN